MSVTLFAAIDVGSYEVEMKIFQCVTRKDIRQIDHIRYRIELGKDTYNTGKVSEKKIGELCRVLNDFVKIMEGYKVQAYRACATSAIREAQNRLLLLEYVEQMTGISIEVLDNSEQRFLDYKSVAFGVKDFYKIIQNGTAIVDVGSGSAQISLFDNDKLVTTQNIKIGNLRIHEKMADFSTQTIHMETMVEELINNELESFKKMYLKERDIRHLVLTGSYVLEILMKQSVTREEYLKMYDQIIQMRPEEIARKYGIPSESASMILPSVTIYKRIIEELEPEIIWLPGMDLSDGIAYDYAQKKKIIKIPHDFNDDIVAAARVMAKRYQCSKGHIRNLENLALLLFDKIKRISGLKERDRLLLQIAVILHSCGKYINMSNRAECSYNIIMSTEIIGLSLQERRIIASVVKYNTTDFTLEDVVAQPQMSNKDYLLITKLVALLRVANAMDRSHRQKFEKVKAEMKEQKLIITVETNEDITLEKGTFPPKADYFEEVFHVRPVIRKKKVL